MKQLLYLRLFEGIFKEVTLVYFHILLQKLLLRFPAGISLYPAIEINFHGCFTSPFLGIITWFIKNPGNVLYFYLNNAAQTIASKIAV